MSVLILDAGNSIIKAKIARREHGEIAFPHAFKPLTETEYTSIVSRAGKQNSLQDYIRINGQPYVVGESAERHGVHTQRTGSSRYTRDYFGIFAATVLGRFYERGMDVSIFGSHPPGDAIYRDDLMKSVIGEWTIEMNGHERRFKVAYANTFDEPVGGLMNVLLTEDGQHYQHTELNGGRSLVIDIGGFTTDWIAVNPGGVVDYSLARSVPVVSSRQMLTWLDGRNGSAFGSIAFDAGTKVLSFTISQAVGAHGEHAGARRKLDVLRKVGLPRTMPYFFASLKVAITLAFVGTTVSEMTAANEGIGYLLISAGSSMQMGLAFAGLVVVGAMAMGMYELFSIVEKRTTGWAHRGSNSA